MAHNIFHTGWDAVKNFLGSEDTSDLRRLLSAGGQAGTALMAANRLEDLGDEAQTDLSSIYDDISDDANFTGFSVTAGPGKVEFDESGSPIFKRTGAFANLPDRLAEAAQYGYDQLYGKTIDPITGEVSFDPGRDRKGFINALKGVTDIEGNFIDSSGRIIEGNAGDFRSQLVNELVGTDTSLTNPFANTAEREKTVYERLRDLRRPGEERARSELQQQLQSQGRLGLQTAEYGAAPEVLALNQAIEETKNRDLLTAMTQARSEAKDLVDARLAGLDEARLASTSNADMINAALGTDLETKIYGSKILSDTLSDAFAPDLALKDLATPAIQGADLANVAKRYLAGIRRDLEVTGLDYDLETERAAAQIRQQLMDGLFQLLAGGTAPGKSNENPDAITELLGPAIEELRKNSGTLPGTQEFLDEYYRTVGG